MTVIGKRARKIHIKCFEDRSEKFYYSSSLWRNVRMKWRPAVLPYLQLRDYKHRLKMQEHLEVS